MMRVWGSIKPARIAASAVKGLMVEPVGKACSKASLGLTTARSRPVSGSITITAPSRPASASVAALLRSWSSSSALSGAFIGEPDGEALVELAGDPVVEAVVGSPGEIAGEPDCEAFGSDPSVKTVALDEHAEKTPAIASTTMRVVSNGSPATGIGYLFREGDAFLLHAARRATTPASNRVKPPRRKLNAARILSR